VGGGGAVAVGGTTTSVGSSVGVAAVPQADSVSIATMARVIKVQNFLFISLSSVNIVKTGPVSRCGLWFWPNLAFVFRIGVLKCSSFHLLIPLASTLFLVKVL
jgi:hypothetical protein